MLLSPEMASNGAAMTKKAAEAGPEVIMLVRHAEKPADGVNGITYAGKKSAESLTPLGWQRAGALCHLFGTRKLPSPDAIFASLDDEGVKGSLRPMQTVAPLAALLNGIADEAGLFAIPPVPTPKVPFDTGISKKHPEQLAAALVAGRGVMLAAWQHEAMADICAALGKLIPIANPQDIPAVWPGERFDMVYRLKRRKDGRYKFRQVPQMLLPGDSDRLFPLGGEPETVAGEEPAPEGT